MAMTLSSPGHWQLKSNRGVKDEEDEEGLVLEHAGTPSLHSTNATRRSSNIDGGSSRKRPRHESSSMRHPSGSKSEPIEPGGSHHSVSSQHNRHKPRSDYKKYSPGSTHDSDSKMCLNRSYAKTDRCSSYQGRDELRRDSYGDRGGDYRRTGDVRRWEAGRDGGYGDSKYRRDTHRDGGYYPRHHSPDKRMTDDRDRRSPSETGKAAGLASRFEPAPKATGLVSRFEPAPKIGLASRFEPAKVAAVRLHDVQSTKKPLITSERRRTNAGDSRRPSEPSRGERQGTDNRGQNVQGRGDFKRNDGYESQHRGRHKKICSGQFETEHRFSHRDERSIEYRERSFHRGYHPHDQDYHATSHVYPDSARNADYDRDRYSEPIGESYHGVPGDTRYDSGRSWEASKQPSRYADGYEQRGRPSGQQYSENLQQHRRERTDFEHTPRVEQNRHRDGYGWRGRQTEMHDDYYDKRLKQELPSRDNQSDVYAYSRQRDQAKSNEYYRDPSPLPAHEAQQDTPQGWLHNDDSSNRDYDYEKEKEHSYQVHDASHHGNGAHPQDPAVEWNGQSDYQGSSSDLHSQQSPLSNSYSYNNRKRKAGDLADSEPSFHAGAVQRSTLGTGIKDPSATTGHSLHRAQDWISSGQGKPSFPKQSPSHIAADKPIELTLHTERSATPSYHGLAPQSQSNSFAGSQRAPDPRDASQTTVTPKPNLENAVSKSATTVFKNASSSATTKSSVPVLKKKITVKSKLGIPMSWLKPAAKPKKVPKPIVKPIVNKKPGVANDDVKRMSSNGQIPRQASEEVASKKQSSLLPNKQLHPLSPQSNRLVTDSEGGSTVSNNKDLLSMISEKRPEQSIPSAIVTKAQSQKIVQPKEETPEPQPKLQSRGNQLKSVDWDELGVDTGSSSSESPSCGSNSDSSSDESDTDDEEVMMWGAKMFGVSPSQNQNSAAATAEEKARYPVQEHASRKPLKLRLKLSNVAKFGVPPSQDSEKVTAQKKISKHSKKHSSGAQGKLKKKGRKKMKKRKKKDNSYFLTPLPETERVDEEQERREREEEKRIKKEAKPLTAAQISAILGEDDSGMPESNTWVRRSVRQPSRALLNSKPLQALIRMLKTNKPEMVVLKMKKFINDPNAPQVVLDTALDALEENTSCEALYIQNFNEGMRDRQVLHLLRILQNPSCKIWCLNIGENYNVETDTWEKFTKGLRRTKITHMYASEHTITTEMKDEIRATIRENRKKHEMHINPNNLDVIIQCTHCWWNPINAKALRPYLRKKGYEHILNDSEAQGLRGSTSEAPAG